MTTLLKIEANRENSLLIGNLILRGRMGGEGFAFRKQYGRDLLMMGGFDKHILAGSKQQIEREVDRLTPLVEEGGFIGFADHRVPPDVPFENYLHYLRTVRKRWGKGTALKPVSWDHDT